MMLLCMLMYGVRIFICVFFFFKQKTAYEMRISDWSSDVCSSDLHSAPSTCFPEGNVEWTNKESVGCGGSLLVLVDIHIQGVVLFVGRRQRFLLRQDLVGGGRHHRGIEFHDVLFRLILLALLLQALHQRVAEGVEADGFVGDLAQRDDGILVVVPKIGRANV